MLVKPEKLVVTGALPGEVHEAKVDQASMAHLIDLLGRGIYKDPERAVLREYACNGRDSMDEADNSGPVQIVLPTTLAPQLRIIDHGIGLSKDGVIRLLTHYGASTKRVEGNTQTGSLGIGGKSGFAYGDQFTIIAIKDGLKTYVSASRTEEGSAQFTFMDPMETDEPNGVEIQIPAKRWNDFPEKAQQLFKYWPRGSITINDQEPTPITEQDGVQRIADDLYMTQDSYSSTSTVVMCNVPYTVPTEAFGVEIGHSRQLIAFVGADAVDFEGAREGLRMTQKTKDGLQAIGERFKTEYIAAMQAEIDGCATPQEAIQCATKWYLASPEGMRPKTWTYNGSEIPKEFAIGQPDELSGRRPNMVVVKRSSSKQKAHSKEQVVPFHTAINAQWFYGYDLEFTSGHRRRIDEWANQKREADPNWTYPDMYILTSKKVVSEYLADDRVASWEEVRAIKMPSRERSEHGRLLGSYDALVGRSDYAHQTLADDVDDAEPVYYYVGDADNNTRWTRNRAQRALPYHTLLRQYNQGCTTLLIPATREAKLLRTFPEAQKVEEAVKGLFQEWQDGLSEDEKKALYILEHTDAHTQLEALDEALVDDPDLKANIVLVKTGNAVQRHNEFSRYQRVHGHVRLEQFQWVNPLPRYPLYTSTHQTQNSNAPHLYLYLNAAYKAAQDAAAALVEEMVVEEMAA